MKRWPAFLVGTFGVIAVIGGALVALLGQLVILGMILAAIGLIVLIGAFVMEVKRVRNLMWMTLEDHRFTMKDNVGERTFNDDDVISMALKYKENFENGTLKSTTRTFRVWIVSQAEQPELIEMATKIKVGLNDTLSGFIERIVNLLKERAQTDRARGQSILGEGWTLEGKKLFIRQAKQAEIETQLEDITAADYIDDKLKLWRKGEDASFVDLPHDAANCHLLKVLLDAEFSQRPRGEEQEPPIGQLGRIIFERKPSKSSTITLFVLAGIAGVATIGLAIAFIAIPLQRDREGLLIASIIAAVIGVLLGVWGFSMRRTIFRCQAFGVRLQTLLAEKSLSYKEMETFTYSATKHYHNGAYIGTNLKMVFNPKKENKDKKIVYSTTVKNIDSSLDEMRDQIAGMLAGRLVAAVQDGQAVEWTPNLTLTPNGVLYIPSGLFTKKTPEMLPYSSIAGHNIEQGNFGLFRLGKPKAVTTEATSARNFFPGFFAFLVLLAEKQSPLSADNTTASNDYLPETRGEE